MSAARKQWVTALKLLGDNHFSRFRKGCGVKRLNLAKE
jgi:hypothetical protein